MENTNTKKPAHRQPNTSEAWQKRKHVWMHNSLHGSVGVAISLLRRVCSASSATPNQKQSAGQIISLLLRLQQDLCKERVNLQGEIEQIGKGKT